MEKIETFSQPILKLENHFIAIWKLGDYFIPIWKFENHLVAKGHFRSTWRIWQGVAMGLRNHFAAKWDFRSRVPFSQPISQLRNGVGRLRNGTRVPKGCFAAAKPPAKWGFGCEISVGALRVRLQTTITSSFQIQIAYRLKHWTPNFLSFKTRYSMKILSSIKCFKNVSNGVRMRHFSSLFAQSSNDHNFFVSTPN